MGKKSKSFTVEPKFSFFIENYISVDHDFPVVWIVQLVSFEIVIIANEDKLLTFIIQLSSFLHMGNAYKTLR